ncbi:hypothetical protein OHB41_00515 [Streptomyces sp. NBC_01571]|uniref:hypothetical protein n=1 Tax=Streptomyces sp. NBC_01571 TaxID=2975883 RepID=UPI00224D479A|nr:hypothetical protein [Streptomyces sp. NBC_01571]MCX4571720.1 hypothetical protein [Streptomyces sp. NBC_01571]
MTSVFANPDRIHTVCQHIVDHYLAGAYRNGLKAQVVAYNRELAVTYTDNRTKSARYASPGVAVRRTVTVAAPRTSMLGSGSCGFSAATYRHHACPGSHGRRP